MTTTLTGKNQITIPAAIVKEMKLEPGTQFEWETGKEPGVIMLKVKPTIRQMLARLQELGDEMKREAGPGWDPIAELMAERELDMELEEAELADFQTRYAATRGEQE